MSSHRSTLESTLSNLDGRNYGSYKQITGRHQLGPVTLFIDRVQSDPFASPSKVRFRVAHEDAGFPPELVTERLDRVAAADYLHRVGHAQLSSDRRGAIDLGAPGQEILERSNVIIDDSGLEARLLINLPAKGRRILGRRAAEILTRELPDLARAMFFHAEWLDGPSSLEPRSTANSEDSDLRSTTGLRDHVQLLRDQTELRGRLGELGLLGFIANGSILPRRSGDSDLPMTGNPVPFRSPASLETTIELSSGRRLTGMGIARGITVIVGGGYHGKSTVLRALERGVYPHIAEDGREWVITEPSATAIRAEDGRAVTGDDISPFINNLPTLTDTRNFSTTNASGSTSQAANLVEAIEAGAQTLLIDEDTSATNFMIRDDRMRALIPAESEPITPFVDRVRPLFARRGVSTVLVAGGSSAFFEVADRVIALDSYVPRDATAAAHELVGWEDHAAGSAGAESTDGGDTSSVGNSRAAASVSTEEPFSTDPKPRVPTVTALRPPAKTKSAKAKGPERIQFGRDFIELAAVSQVTDSQQTAGIAEALEYLAEIFDGRTTVTAALAEIEAMLDAQGVDGLTGHRDHPGHLTRPRMQEVAAALNRYRGLTLA